MDRYIITSIRVGEIGTAFVASPSDDIEWLLAGGFIQRSDTHPSKGAKLATKPDEPKSTKGWYLIATSTVLSNPVVKIGAVDLSDQCTSATLSQKIQNLQANAFGSTAIAYVGGLQDNTLSLDLYWSTAASETYATLKSLVGTVITTVTIQGSSAATSATNPIGTLTGSYLPELPVVYSLGELTKCTIQLMGGTFAWTEAWSKT